MNRYLPKPPEVLLPLLLATIFTVDSSDPTLPFPLNIPTIWVIFFAVEMVIYLALRTFVLIALEENLNSKTIKGLLLLGVINLLLTTAAFFGILHLRPQPPLPIIQWVAYPSLSLFIALSEIIALVMIVFMTFLGFRQFANDL